MQATNVQGIFSNDGSNLPYTNVSTSFDDNEIVNVYEWTEKWWHNSIQS